MNNVQREINRRRRAKNWQAVKAMGSVYKGIYLIASLVSMIIFFLGLFGLFQNWGGLFDFLWVVGLGLGIVFCGGMTIIANIAQVVRKRYLSIYVGDLFFLEDILNVFGRSFKK